MTDLTPAARIRRWYWKRIRGYRYETCGRSDHPHAAIRRGCGRPVGVIWRAPTGLWNHVISGELVKGPSKGIGGVLCLACFDRLAQERGVPLQWESRPLSED
jgi:hypothetical protein